MVKGALSGDVTATELSEILGVTDQTLRNLARDGMPKGSRGRYPLRDAARFYLDTLRRRKESGTGDGPTKADLERDILLQKLKAQRGEVFDREAVLSVWTGAHARLAKGMDSFATNLGREFNLTGEDVKLIRDRLDEMRRDYVRDSREFGEVVEGGENAGAIKAA